MKPEKECNERRSAVMTGLGIVFCAALGFLLLCNLLIIIRGSLNPERPPSVFGVTPLVVLSGSMSGEQEGHIEVGDMIFVQQAEPEQLKTGDVIAYMAGDGSAVTHRIAAVETDEAGELLFTTKGDANDAEDTEKVAADQLVGVYRGRIPKVGDLAMFLQKPLGMFLFIGVPLLAFIIYDIIRRQRFAGREQERIREMEEELERLRSGNEENGGSRDRTVGPVC